MLLDLAVEILGGCHPLNLNNREMMWRGSTSMVELKGTPVVYRKFCTRAKAVCSEQ